MCATLGSSDGSGHEERVGDARGNGIGWDYSDGDGRFWGSGRGAGSDNRLGFPATTFPVFWCPETILHAYAYMNATSQEEKDAILGLMELSNK